MPWYKDALAAAPFFCCCCYCIPGCTDLVVQRYTDGVARHEADCDKVPEDCELRIVESR